MKVKFRVTCSDGEGTKYVSGRTYDVPESVAKNYVGRGYADVQSSAARAAAKRVATRRAPRKAAARKPKQK